MNVVNDHESRHGNYRIEDEAPNAVEAMPLLPRFPRPRRRVNITTVVVVGLLVLSLMSGFSIGVYLLIIESSTDNVVPSVQIPPLFVARGQWDAMSPHFAETVPVFNAKSLIVGQTYSGQCSEEEQCIKLMHQLELNINENKTLPYNFMISTDGHIFEYLGWEHPSPLFPGQDAILVAFIGIYGYQMPSHKQIESAGNILTASVSNGYLKKDFVLTVQDSKMLGSNIIRNTMINQYKAAVERTRRFSPRLYFLKSDEFTAI